MKTVETANKPNLQVSRETASFIGCLQQMQLLYSSVYSSLELEKHSFAICHCESNGDVIIVKLLTDGKLYIADNPSLQNPFDWKWLIPLAVSIISIILSLIACTKTI